ncbi:MAG: 4-alpha-glucanotransferase [Parachlamydiaceae bacterium]|nr:4-alpha-glucanotransferase [Parachlamydiaceae bacterium]
MDKIDASYFSHSPTAKLWENIGIQHHHGIVIPLFSLHSELSYGIGEFPDLIPIIDWCKTIGLDVIQLLPLNGTGHETSPYGAISAFSLNTIHIGLACLPFLEKYPVLIEELKTIPKHSSHQRIPYTAVRETKEKFLRHYYELVGPTIRNSDDYKNFIQHSHWLKGFAVFKTLKAKYDWVSWEKWPEALQSPTTQLLQELEYEHQNEIEWHYFLQFISHEQLTKVKRHATSQGVFIMGDIPILINRDSSDVWLHRELFHMEFCAGAPPDMYSAEGQNWGFPIYAWDPLSAQGYKWWIDRLRLASHYYHIYRIDHIVGFFRIWSIPFGMESKDGHYIPIDPNVWIDHGQKIMLMMINNCDMLPIGEDLGNVPPIVRTCLSALGICGTKVMRWEREWEKHAEFIPIGNYPVASLTTVSTHDSETLQLWWTLHESEAKDFATSKGWSYQPTLSREHHNEILWDSHHSNSLFHINPLQEYLALIPGLTWPNLEDERINSPGIISENNWTYRFKPSVEEIVNNQTLIHLLKELIQ